MLPLVPELAHLVLSRRRELGTSCSNALHSVDICLKSSHTVYSLLLGAKVSLKIFQTISPWILTSQPYLSLFISEPPPIKYCCSHLPQRHFVPLLLVSSPCRVPELVLWAAGTSPLLHWLCLALAFLLNACTPLEKVSSKYFNSASLLFPAIHPSALSPHPVYVSPRLCC